MLGNFLCFLVSADLFQNHFPPKKSFRNTIKVSSSLDSDYARQNTSGCDVVDLLFIDTHFVGFCNCSVFKSFVVCYFVSILVLQSS